MWRGRSWFGALVAVNPDFLWAYTSAAPSSAVFLPFPPNPAGISPQMVFAQPGSSSLLQEQGKVIVVFTQNLP